MSNSSCYKLSISKFKFGVELEFDIDYDEFEEESVVPNGWHSHDEHCGTEVVSPPLSGYKGLFELRRGLRQIWQPYDRLGFDDCGLHVHVDIQHWKIKHAKRLLIIGSVFNEAIFALMDGSRYNNEFVRHCNYKISDILKCKSLWDLQKLQSYERYHGINMYAFNKHGTVEFRYASGTADWSNIYSLISMYLRMVAYAGSNLSIPEECEKIPSWSSCGPMFAEEKMTKLTILKNKMFDMLQIKGDVRKLLDNMFDKNASQMTAGDYKTERQSRIRGLRKVEN